MEFTMEFAEREREREGKFRKLLYKLQDRCKKTKETWSLPLRPHGFWTFERHNAQIYWDSQISQVTGRRDPLDHLHTVGAESKPVLERPYGWDKFQDIILGTFICGPLPTRLHPPCLLFRWHLINDTCTLSAAGGHKRGPPCFKDHCNHKPPLGTNWRFHYESLTSTKCT